MARLPAWVRWSLVGLVGIVVVNLAANAVQVVVWRSGWRPGLDVIRRFNKMVRNPVVLKRTGKRITAVHHTGRKSGRDYVTPVWAEQSGSSFLIHLPYGIDVDWCRNVLAAGTCVLEHEGVRFDAVDPVIMPAADAVPLLSPLMRRMDRLIGVESYLRLDIGPHEPAS